MKKTKRIVSLLLAGLMIFLLVGCGDKKEDKRETTVLTYEANGVSIEYRMESTGDVVKKITQESTLDYSAYTDDQILAMEELLEEYALEYNKMKSVTYSYKNEGSTFVETIVMDTTVDGALEELQSIGMGTLEEDAKYISLEMTIDNMESMGFELQE